MRRMMAFLFALAVFLFSLVGCGTMDSLSSDDGATAQSTTTTVTSSTDGETSATLNGSTDTTTTTTEWKITTQKTMEFMTICPTMPPPPTTTTVRTTQPTVAPASRLPEVEYLVNDYSIQYTDIVNLKKGG